MDERETRPLPEVPPAILEYRGPAQQQTKHARSGLRPISLSLAAGVVYFVAGALVLMGGLALCLVVKKQPSSYPVVPISILVVLSGAGLLALEYGAEAIHNRACAVAVGIVCSLVAVPLGLVVRKAMPLGLDHAAVPIVLMGIAVFCAVVHFRWAHYLKLGS